MLLILFAPFFIFVFSPLLQMNIIAGALAGGIYLELFSPAAPGRWKPISNASAGPTALNMAKCGSQAASAGRYAPR
ncbi:MFS transporter [Klebsiella variicola subsp. variicola]|nr:MFS transporter [Klebsiella variicola subsp. variicola]